MTLEAIRASAGSGKTYSLTTRYLRAYRSGSRPEEILATTFTRKAAGEILRRLMGRLAEAAVDVTDKKAETLGLDLGGGPLTRQECRDLVVSLCRRINRVTVSTIDSFFAALLDAFRLHSDMPFGVSTVGSDDVAVRRARRQAVFAIAERIGPDAFLDFIERINRGQVTTTITAVIDTLTDRVFELYRTSTDQAWRSLVAPSGQNPRDVAAAVSTLATVSQTVNHKSYEKGLLKDVECARDERWLDLLGSTIFDKVRNGDLIYYKKEISAETCRAYGLLTEHATSLMISQVAAQTEAIADLLSEFTSEFDLARKRLGLMTFSDVPFLLAKIVSQCTQAEVESRLGISVNHLLLDEFQDTDPVQWKILQPFARSVASRQGAGTFFCVGDAKQSIYGWRGAVPQIFADLDNDIAGIAWDDSCASYRSSEHVLAAVNRVFGTLAGNWALCKYPAVASRWQETYVPHHAKKGLPGYVELVAVPESQDEGDADGAEEGYDSADYSRLAYEATRIVSIADAAPRCTVGVLMRKNRSVAAMISLLRTMGLDASDEGGNPIDGEPSVELVLSAITLADHPADTACAYHVLKSPLAAALSLRDIGAGNTATVAADIRDRLLGEGYGRVVRDWATLLAGHTSSRGARKLAQLVELAEAFDRKPTLRPADFVALVRSAKVEDAAASRVRVMSIHKSKGLEFDIVLLPELGGRVPALEPVLLVDREPSSHSVRAVYRNPQRAVRLAYPAIERVYDAQVGEEVRESLCLLYVAMTRARYALHMFVPKVELSLNPDKPPAYVPSNVVRLALGGTLESLTDGAERLYRNGDDDWYGLLPDDLKLPIPPAGDQAGERSAAVPVDIMRAKRFVPRTVPSRLENDGRVSIDALIRSDNDGPRMLGRAIHALFATAHWADGPVPSDMELTGVLARDVPGQGGVWYATQVGTFRSLLRQPGVRSALSAPDLVAGERVELWRERRFAVHFGDRITEGIFDRVTVIYQGNSVVRATITDFKTDNVPVEAVANRADGYRPQVDTYRKALATMLQLAETEIAARLIFLLPDVSIALTCAERT